MYKLFAVFFMLGQAIIGNGQNKINTALKFELDSIYQKDQELRELISTGLLQTKADSLAEAFKIPKSELVNYVVKMIPVIDSMNMIRIRQVIKKYGYPGKTLVGPGTNEAAFYVIQHSPNLEEYLPLIKKAASARELPFTLYAMMVDRSLMYKEKEQVYGTQGKGFQVLDSITGQRKFIQIIWPVKDAVNVNARRKKAGFRLTIEAYAKQELGIEYKALSLAEVMRMRGL